MLGTISLFEKIRGRVAQKFPKEYLCHLQFVLILAQELQLKKGGDLEVINIAAIGHDIGRQEGADNKLHPEKGSRLITEWVKEFGGMEPKKLNLLARCVLMHGQNSGFSSVEEQIISNADALSKLCYHENYMLMCKKETYLEKAAWGLKYVEKGFQNISFDDVREEYGGLYEFLVKKYQLVLRPT